MTLNRQRAEQAFFRALNAVVEPAVRSGLASSRWTPSSLIVLETVGYKSGKTRRTPLLANRVGKHLLVSTFRGDRSFWVRNLERSPDASFYIGGKRIFSSALVINSDKVPHATAALPGYLVKLASLLSGQTHRGWAFALLPLD